MKHTTRIAAIALTAFAAITSVKAGSETKNPVTTNAAATPAFTFVASENYDSRYVFRGVDVLTGTGILSTTFAPTWHITANDTLTVPLWYGTAVAKNKYASQYRELDVPVNYLHTFDNGFNLGAGYTLYNYFNAQNLFPNTKGGTAIQNEINVTGGYSKKFGDITLLSSLTYFYELGTPVQYSYGSINPGSSYLSPSLGASIPLNFIKKDGSITFNPNTQYNISFVYNLTNAGEYVSGGNNWQFQLPVTWQVTKTWSVTGYWAYEYQGLNLAATANSFGWAGCSVGASF